ncbi:hypothetical protein FJY94_03605 [Candidatus Kaiserbacteria bacterium]|nr:hypothetical protein [Candidatus Kaiserbacteria bacterium]
MSPHASPIAVSGGLVFVVNTPAATVDIIDADSRAIVRRVNVGIEPVGIAVRPDGKEVWISNHVSDSVSVIDVDPASPTRFEVIATVQDFDAATKATRFDEPVGIAFASNEKAYVSLSSENKIAVVNVASRQVEKRLDITAQDPRAIVVRNGRLYVIPFESNNQTQISDDDSTLVVSAAGSDRLFTVDATTGAVLGRVEVGAVPQGIALESSTGGKPSRAWVLNAAANTVSLVDLSDPASPQVAATITLEDPTHPAVKRGRIAFSTAASSTTGTFSCASCHPDGHTDQLLWVLKTPIVTGGDQIMPRSTMPVRGLRDTAPFHWDGIPGDPYGGINSAHIRESVPPNSKLDQPESTTRHLIDGGLASTMSKEGDKSVNDEGKAGKLTAKERDDMAKFLLSVPYPPAQRRAYNNVLSSEAVQGFKLFHIDGDNDPSKSKPNRCGDCHRMPFLVSTNTPGTGMDAPTWRGAYDRWLILPQGRLNIIDFDFYQRVAEQGAPERSVWQFSWGGRNRFDPVWEMVLEGSTGFSGAFARQVTLNQKSSEDALTIDLLNALEQAARDGGVVLQGEGVLLEKGKSVPVALQFDPQLVGGTYTETSGDRESFSRATLTSLASNGRFIGTFTGRLGSKVDCDHPQPALWTLGPIEEQRGKQEFPVLFGKNATMTMSGRHIQPDAQIVVDGHRVAGSVNCEGETVKVELAAMPSIGIHFLQVQNLNGLVSNEFIFHVAERDQEAVGAKRQTLGEILRQSKWDRLIGTWVDADTKGAGLTSTYSWKIKDRVIESTSKENNNESVALMAINAESGEVFQTGSDRNGTSFTGKWQLPKDGDAVLDVAFTSGSGEKGSLKLRYHLVNDDSLMLTIELPQPISIKMIRINEETQP